MTSDGYPDQVYAALHPSRPGLKLVKLGCPGETTTSMINGGICHYQGGSQLAAAVTFLQAHRGRVLLVTLDIGANDPEAMIATTGDAIAQALNDLQNLDPDMIRKQRRQKFLDIGRKLA